MGGTQAVEAAEAGGDADRAAGIGAEGEVNQPAGDGRGRAAGGTAGDAAGRPGVDWGAVVGVFAEDAASQFVSVRFAHHSGPGVHEGLDDPGGVLSRGMRGLPVRVAASGYVALDVENVLGGEGQSGQGPSG